jgi:hypothetical protein
MTLARQWQESALRAALLRLLRQVDGAVSAELVVACAIVVGFGVAAAAIVGTGTREASENVGRTLEATEIATLGGGRLGSGGLDGAPRMPPDDEPALPNSGEGDEPGEAGERLAGGGDSGDSAGGDGPPAQIGDDDPGMPQGDPLRRDHDDEPDENDEAEAGGQHPAADQPSD